MNLYIVLKDGLIGKLNGVCRCSKCMERGSPEIEIVNLDGYWADSVKINSLKDEDILYFGESLQSAVDTCVEHVKSSQKQSSHLRNLIGFVDTLE